MNRSEKLTILESRRAAKYRRLARIWQDGENVRWMYQNGFDQYDIAERYRVSQTVVRSILQGYILKQKKL